MEKLCKNCKHWDRHSVGKLFTYSDGRDLRMCDILGITDDKDLVKEIELGAEQIATDQNSII